MSLPPKETVRAAEKVVNFVCKNVSKLFLFIVHLIHLVVVFSLTKLVQFCVDEDYTNILLTYTQRNSLLVFLCQIYILESSGGTDGRQVFKHAF